MTPISSVGENLIQNVTTPAWMNDYQVLSGYLERNLDKWYRLERQRRDVLDKRSDMQYDFFSRKLFAPSRDARVVRCGEPAVAELLAQRAIYYDRSTALLETQAVIPELIAFHQGAFDAHDDATALREAAAQAINDEARHAANAARVESFVKATGVTPLRLPDPGFLDCLQQQLERHPKGQEQLVRFTFCFATETLISGTLKQLPLDVNVHPVVREEVAQHAVDEGRHQALYGDRFVFAWSRLSSTERKIVADVLPKFITAFLTPDASPILTMLRHIGIAPEVCKNIVEDCYSRESLRSELRHAAAASVRYCVQAGAFEDECLLARFVEAGLILTDSVHDHLRR